MTDPRRLLLLLFLANLPEVLGAQTIVPEGEPEAPEALFDQKIGDVGVVLEADGTWTSRFALGWGSGFSSEGEALPALGYPGYEQGTVFSQVPDFTLTLRLVERYYLELTYAGTVKDRSFLVGYQGQGTELVQWAKAGNAPFTVPTRAGQTLAAGRLGAAAAGAGFHGDHVDTEFLIRYEDGTRETKTYQGFREASASTVTLDNRIQNRFFRLPGPYPVSGVRILVSDPDGTLGSSGDRYREATSAEAVADLLTGEVRLSAPATRRFLVTWGSAASWSNPATTLLGLTAEAGPVIGTSTWYVLVRPGSPSAFELRNRYPVASGTTGAIVLTRTDEGTTVSGFSVVQASSQDWFEVDGEEEAPFLGEAGGVFDGLYPGGGPPPQTDSLPWVFRLPTATTASSYSLGTDVLASSILVVRNGTPVTAFHFDEAAGTLTLDVPVYETDTVVISLQRTASSDKAADLVLWQGGRWDLGTQALEWNLQGRWNMENGRYTTEDLQSPGRIAATVAWTGTAGEWTWSAAATGGALLADSTGHRQIYGWSDAGTKATLDGDALRPSAAPGTVKGLTLDAAHRAPTLFRNYWSNDPLTGEAQVSAWGKSGITAETWEAGGWMGPYLVRGDGERTDRLAVAEAPLESGEWSGLQVFLDAGAPRAMESTSAVSARVRLVGGQAGDRVFLQAGTLSEDFDGTGAVRSVEYRAFPALAFSDEGTRRYFPVPEDSSWGNDGEDDGAAGVDGDLVTLELADGGFSPTDETWQTVRFILSDTQRQTLARTTGWRMVIVGGALASGTTKTLLAGPVVFEGSGWTVTSATGSGSVNPVEEARSSGSSKYQLRVDWSAQSAWTIEGRHSPVRSAAYQTIAFRYRLASLGTAASVPLVLSLTDSDGRGLKAAWEATVSSGWTEVKIDLSEKKLTLGGTATGTVTLNRNTDSWDRMTLSMQGTGEDSGTLYLAEVEAVDPLWEPVGTTTVKTTWKQTEAWPSRELPLVTGTRWETTSIQSGLTAADASWVGQTTLSGSVGPVRASGEASFERSASAREAHGAYETVVPLTWPGGPSLEWTERFSDRGVRSERLRLTLPWLGVWEAAGLAEGVPDSLDQQYRAAWSAPGELPAGWAATASAQWNQSGPTDLTLSDFGTQWAESWGWLVPVSEVAPYHLVQGQGTFKVPGGPAFLEGSLLVKTAQTVGSSVTKWTPGGNWSLKLPLSLNTGGPWILTPSVTKKVEAVFAGTEALDPGTSAETALAWLENQPGGLAALPFGEQTATRPWSGDELQSGTIESTAGLDWERTGASDWTDLILPLSGGTKVTAVRGQDGAAGYRTATGSAAVQARAVNLFGQLGASPIFDWYQTDVWTWSASGSRSIGTRASDQAADAALTVRSDLVFNPGESLGMPVVYQGHWGSDPTQTLGWKPTWTLKGPADLPFEFPRWLSPKAFQRMWIQEISGVLDLGWEPVTSPFVRNLQVSWKGRFLLSDKSELSLTTRWGQQWQSTVTVVGLDASLDLILSF